jgi:hypothetical protein
LKYSEEEQEMKVCGKTHEKKHDRVYNKGSEIEQLGTETVSEGSPEGRGESGDETRGAYDGADPEKGFRERIRADIENIEGQKDINEIEGKG